MVKNQNRFLEGFQSHPCLFRSAPCNLVKPLWIPPPTGEKQPPLATAEFCDTELVITLQLMSL